MAQLINGENFILFFRDYSKRATEDAAKLRFQTEHSLSFEKESEATKTKDGMINTITDGENTGEITSLAYVNDDDTIETWKILREMFKANKLVEMWEVDFTGATENDLAVEPTYYQGYFTAFEISAPADDKVELTFSYAINGNGVEGKDTLTESQLKAVKSNLYEYHKLAKETGAGEATDQ